MNPRHVAGEDHDCSRPLDNTSHRQARWGNPRQELMLDPIARGRLYRSLRHIQLRIESSLEPACMNPRHAASEDHDG
jgi:hypothetical protein